MEPVKPRYGKILLKLSGEALAGKQGYGIDPEIIASIAAEIKAEVDAATEHSEAEPDPDPSTAMRWVFAEDWPSETPPAWGFGGGHGMAGHEGDRSAAEGATD